jgi:hypothetical protein
MNENISNQSNESSIIYPLDELLNSLGILPIDVYIYEIVIPIVASIGLILNILSTWIFFQKKFSTPIYWYFRVVSITNSSHMVFALPYGICFTPTHFPTMDSYSCTVVQCVYIPFVAFTTNFVAILEIAILLERIKIINPFVKKYFTISSNKMISITFFTCLLFNCIAGFLYAPYYGGDFYFYDSNGKERGVNSFWFLSHPNKIFPVFFLQVSRAFSFNFPVDFFKIEVVSRYYL